MSDQPDPPRPLSPLRKAWGFLRLLARPALARKLGTLVTEGYLAETGWVRSVCTGKVVDAHGGPQPWATLPFIDFIRPRMQRHWRVFEYGAGASTLFFARHVAAVTAVEHDGEFATQLRPGLPAHARVWVHPAGSDAYAEALGECAEPPDIVSVDGQDRVRCIAAALPRLSATAVLVLDDAERPEYAPAKDLLQAAGFRPVEFWGLAPGRVERKCTAIFYRMGNILEL
jgi:hypothetical protein